VPAVYIQARDVAALGDGQRRLQGEERLQRSRPLQTERLVDPLPKPSRRAPYFLDTLDIFP
jgi:hypothetical protein